MFKSNPSKTFEKFFTGIDFENSTWLTFAVNQPEQSKGGQNISTQIQFEVHTSKSVSILKFSNSTPQKIQIEAWIGKKRLYNGEVSKNTITILFTAFLDQFMQKVRDLLITMAKEESVQTINPTNEPQALEWMNTTLLVLKNALERAFLEEALQCNESEEQNLLNFLLFCGRQPNSGNSTFRLRIFNLDFDLIEDKTHTLRLRVFNKGKADTFKGIEPAFSGFFTQSKNNIIDQFVQLLSPIAQSFYSTEWKEYPQLQ